MEYTEFKTAAFVALKESVFWSYRDYVFHTSLECLKKEFIRGEDVRKNFILENYKRERIPGGIFLEKYSEWFAVLLWELMTRGILALNYNATGQEIFDFNYFRVTKYGLSWLKQESKPIPEDEDGFIKFLGGIQDIDPVIIEYMSEAISTFNKDCFLASAVMTGAAAERIIYLLSKLIIKLELEQGLIREISKALEIGKVKTLLDKFPMTMIQIKKLKQIPYELREESGNFLICLLDAARIQRNNAVHPERAEVSKESLRLLLLSFPHACKKAYELIAWLKAYQS